jgi:signal transduction histidine kinase
VFGVVVLLALAVAGGAYPLIRRLTRRLERLQRRVEALGAGELSSRVEVEGRDEVAELAGSFNRTAERIERLVEAQRMLLAGASHELRSPLTRLRVALELLGDQARPELRERILHDIEELDGVIGELLLASRMEAAEAIERREPVDLLGLAAEEAARYGVEVEGEPVVIEGDAPLLRRLLRNLLENGRRHAPGSALEVEVVSDPDGSARLRVSDRGPGLSEADRERVFEPFYRAGTSGQGIGLGLTIVRRIARLHGGEVGCRSREGGGATFEVRLPR